MVLYNVKRDIFPFNQTEEEKEFLEFLSELQENDPLIPLDILINQNKIFTPFELNEDLNLHLIDSDPDVQFYNSQCNNSLHFCDHHVENYFNNKVSDLNLCLSMVHMNIRSIVKNLNKFDLYLSNLNHEFPIIALSETLLKGYNCYRYGIDGYNAEHNCRPNRGGGGVSFYIKETIEYTLRDDLCFQNNIVETLFIEIDKSVCKEGEYHYWSNLSAAWYWY